jgi:Zn-dependent M28 family amino/carboxypeptidase
MNKRKYACIGCFCQLLFCFIPYVLSGAISPEKNSVPALKNVQAKIDYAKRRLQIDYNLNGGKNDSIAIKVVLVNSYNEEIIPAKAEVSGDIGFPVFPGLQKRLSFTFDKEVVLHQIRSVRITASNAANTGMEQLLRGFDSTRLRKNLQQIGKERNLYNDSSQIQLENVRNLITASFNQGRLSTYRQRFQVQNIKGQNIIGQLASKDPKEKGTLIIGAHYDTVEGSAGVDDNATGVATLIEIAHILSGYDFKYNIRFVAFDLEESINGIKNHGGIEGSKAFVKQGGIRSTDSIIGFINLDMLGYYSKQKNSQQFPLELKPFFPALYDKVEKNDFRGDFLLTISNATSADLYNTLQAVGNQYLPELSIINVMVTGNGEEMPDFRRSDHANFWDNGYHAISLGDGAFSRNPHYHSPLDKFEDINEHFLGLVTKLLLLTAARQSGMNNVTTVVSVVNGDTKAPKAKSIR